MTYEEALKVWASKKYGFELESINNVSISHRHGYGGGCDTCGYGADDGGMDVSISFHGGIKNFYKEYDFYEFDTVLRELVEAGQS